MRTIMKITRAILLFIYNVEYINQRYDFYLNHNIIDNQIAHLKKFIKNYKKTNYTLFDFNSLYNSSLFFPEVKKINLSKKDLFYINLYFEMKNEKKLINYLFKNNSYGILTDVMVTLFIIYIYYYQNKKYIILYDYNMFEIHNEEKLENVITVAEENILAIEKNKKQYTIEEIKNIIRNINFSFIDLKFQIKLFGSVAKNTNNSKSDIDILLLWNKDSNLIPMYEKTIYQILSNKFIGNHIDLVSIVKGSNLTYFQSNILSYAIKLSDN